MQSHSTHTLRCAVHTHAHTPHHLLWVRICSWDLVVKVTLENTVVWSVTVGRTVEVCIFSSTLQVRQQRSLSVVFKHSFSSDS